MVSDSHHASFRLLVASPEPAHAAEAERQSGDIQTLQTVVVHIDVATCDGKGERTGIRHSSSILLIFPRIFGRMREEPDVESRHPSHDDEGGPMTVGYRFHRGA